MFLNKFKNRCIVYAKGMFLTLNLNGIYLDIKYNVEVLR